MCTLGVCSLAKWDPTAQAGCSDDTAEACRCALVLTAAVLSGEGRGRSVSPPVGAEANSSLLSVSLGPSGVLTCRMCLVFPE